MHAISGDLLLHSSYSQKDLSARLENHHFDQLLFQSSPANRARLLSVSSRHAASWLCPHAMLQPGSVLTPCCSLAVSSHHAAAWLCPHAMLQPGCVLTPCCSLAVSSHHAAAWLSVIPSVGLNLHLEPDEFQIALKWWLGMDTSLGSCCPCCPDHQLDPLGHHAVMCKGGGDVILRHNSLRDSLK